jgi:hypothetical protein
MTLMEEQSGKDRIQMRIMLLSLILSIVACSGAEISSTFFRAMHQVETSGRLGAVLGDSGKSLGPLQISKAYWQDANIGGKYSSCSSYSYSVRVVTSYLTRYCRNGSIEQMARCHNSGPSWRKKYHLTANYWRKFKRELDKLK